MYSVVNDVASYESKWGSKPRKAKRSSRLAGGELARGARPGLGAGRDESLAY